MTAVVCNGCDEPMTDQEWLDGHWDRDGRDYHWWCCPICNQEPPHQYRPFGAIHTSGR